MTTRVLVAEDDPTVAEVAAMYPRRDGHEVEWVTDGVTALNRARSAPPDLVILDILLPGLDGLEVCRRIRERAPTPVVMLTALGEETDRVLGLELGADDYVTKPFSPRELALRVRSVLRRAGALSPPVTACSVTVISSSIWPGYTLSNEPRGRWTSQSTQNADSGRLAFLRRGLTLPFNLPG